MSNKFYSLLCVIALVLAPISANAGTMTVGQKIPLEIGFGAPFGSDLASVTYVFTWPSGFLELQPDSLAAATEIYETESAGVITGVFSGSARDGKVSAPMFKAIAPTLVDDNGNDVPINIDVQSVTAVDSKGKAYNVTVEMPEALVIKPEQERPVVVWRFHFGNPVGD